MLHVFYHYLSLSSCSLYTTNQYLAVFSNNWEKQAIHSTGINTGVLSAHAALIQSLATSDLCWSEKKAPLHLTRLRYTSAVSTDAAWPPWNDLSWLWYRMHLYTISPLCRDDMHVFTSQPTLVGQPLQSCVCIPLFIFYHLTLRECHLLPEIRANTK